MQVRVHSIFGASSSRKCVMQKKEIIAGGKRNGNTARNVYEKTQESS